MKKREKKIIDHLASAWNEFVKLDKEHPDEQNDFANGIHQCQYIMGMRVARKHESKIFPIKTGDR